MTTNHATSDHPAVAHVAANYGASRHGPIHQLSEHLALRSGRREGREAFAALERAGATAPECSDLYGLASSCHDPARARASGELLARLIPLAVGDELVALVVLVALRPGLRRVAARLVRLGVGPEEAESDVIATAYCELRRIAGCAGRPDAKPGEGSDAGASAGSGDGPLAGHVASVLLERTWASVRTLARSRRVERERNVVLSEEHDVLDEKSDPSALVPRLLEDARRAGVLSARQAALLAGSVLGDRSTGELTAVLSISPGHLRLETFRARSSLRAFVTAGTTEALR